MIPELGTLQEANLREAWPHEAQSFTPWLAQNLDKLAGILGIGLEFEGREVDVQPFWADILARNPFDNSLVLIENQLEEADHLHLGQIMTYLAGLDVRTVIWIAKGFRDAHLSAMRWLNDHTDDEFAFFAVRLKVVHIGQSPLAPVFEVLVRPNEWERRLQLVTKETQELTEAGQFLRAFWSRYIERYPEERKYGEPGSYSRWRRLPSGVVIASSIGKGKVSIYIRGDFSVPIDEIYEKLLPYESDISKITGAPIRNSKRDRLFERVLAADTKDEARWDELAKWLYDTANQYEGALLVIGS